VAKSDQEYVGLRPLEMPEDLRIVHLFERSARRLEHIHLEARMGCQKPIGRGGRRSFFAAE
jgi:hypothetical protein